MWNTVLLLYNGGMLLGHAVAMVACCWVTPWQTRTNAVALRDSVCYNQQVRHAALRHAALARTSLRLNLLLDDFQRPEGMCT